MTDKKSPAAPAPQPVRESVVPLTRAPPTEPNFSEFNNDTTVSFSTPTPPPPRPPK